MAITTDTLARRLDRARDLAKANNATLRQQLRALEDAAASVVDGAAGSILSTSSGGASSQFAADARIPGATTAQESADGWRHLIRLVDAYCRVNSVSSSDPSAVDTIADALLADALNPVTEWRSDRSTPCDWNSSNA